MSGDRHSYPLSRLASELERRFGVRLELTEATEELLIFSGSDDRALPALVGEAHAGFDASTAVHSAADERRGRFTR